MIGEFVIQIYGDMGQDHTGHGQQQAQAVERTVLIGRSADDEHEQHGEEEKRHPHLRSPYFHRLRKLHLFFPNQNAEERGV